MATGLGRGTNLGILALVVAAGGLCTGLFLALNYAATWEAAHDSVAHIDGEVLLGRFLRGLHHWAGTLALLLAGLHGWRLFWRGYHKRPRQRLWLLGSGIFLVLVGFAYTGYLLPGDERALSGIGVAEGIAGSTPLVGEPAAVLLRGGSAISSATLTRIHALHTMVLPLALGLLLWLFVREWRRLDATLPPPEREPIDTRRLALGALMLLGVWGALALFAPPALGVKADLSGAGSPDAKPEWFLLWVNKLLKVVPGKTFLIGALLPGLLVMLGVCLPFLSRSAERAPRRRRLEIGLASGVVFFLALLTLLSWMEPAPVAIEEEAPPAVLPGNDGEDAAATEAVLKRFRCASCHLIDDAEAASESGPALRRQGFGELYTRKFFRAKVGDPRAFWPDTGMEYRPKSLKPSPEELDLLERFFFGG